MSEIDTDPQVFASIQDAVREAAEADGNRKRLYELLADELRARILSGELAEGLPLPGEREFVTRTGLGRGSVREAIRILESEGLLSPKSPGRYGQSVVQPVPDRSVHRQLELFIRGGAISSADLTETRLAVEPMLARLAARNRTPAELDHIRALNAQMKATPISDRRSLKRLNFDWHIAVARASHNELLLAIMIGISNAHDMASALEEHGSDEHCRLMITAHDRIVTAIAQRDGDTAARRMHRHLDSYARGLARYMPDELPIDGTA